jgi:hypothetical protein
LSIEIAFANAACAVIWPEVCPLLLRTMVEEVEALLTDEPMPASPCSDRFATLMRVLTLVPVFA